MSDLTPASKEIVVSAIVSTYNSARFIRGCIEDLEQQTIADQIEIIVIDSNSPENEGTIVRELQASHDNIRYLRTDERETVYAAWNRAIAMARGRYITNANSDDRHRVDALEIMAAVLDNDPSVDLVYADVLITETPNETFAQNSAVGRHHWFPWDRNTLLEVGCFIGPQPMWRSSLHTIYGMFDPRFVSSGDYEFWLRISQTSDFHYIEEPLGLYLRHGTSLEHKNEQLKFRENSEILSIYRQAATEGKIVGNTPLDTLRKAADSLDTGMVSNNISAALTQIDEIIGMREATVDRRHTELRQIMLSGPVDASQILQFVASTEAILLGRMEWYQRFRASGSGGVVAALMLDQMTDKALADAHRHAQRGETDKAVSVILNRAIKVAPSSAKPYFELAEILVDSGRYDDALQVMPELPADADQDLARELEAICHCALGNDSAAEAAARQAMAGGRKVRTGVVLGTLNARRGNLESAKELFINAVASDSACCTAWLALGMLHWGGGRQEDAWQALCRAVQVDPLNAEAVQIFCDLAARLARQDTALGLIRSAAARFPDSIVLARSCADLMAQCGRLEETMAACEAFFSRFDIQDDMLALARALRGHLGAMDRTGEAIGASVTLCMIVKNEESNLARCLASAMPIVHEMVIVDTGSDDRTVDLATAFGARVIHTQWNGDYAQARNVALEAAKGSWILVLDADEALSPRDYPLIQGLVAQGATTAWQVMTRNYTDHSASQGWEAHDGLYPDEEAADGWYPSWKVRLFPRHAAIRFRGKVHEMVEPVLRELGIEIKRTSFVVHHYGELDREACLKRKRHYFELGREKLADHPDDPVMLTELAVQAGELEMPQEALSLWDRLLALVPGNIEGHFNRGYVLMSLGRYNEAMADARRVLQNEPDHKEAALNLAVCELHAGSPEAARLLSASLAQRHRSWPPLMALELATAIVAGDRHAVEISHDPLLKGGYAVGPYLKGLRNTLVEAGRGDLAGRIAAWAEEAGYGS